MLLGAALALAGLCGAVLVVGLWLSAPRQTVVGAPPPELPTAQAVMIPSGSGATLKGWWLPGRPGAGAVVLMHGVRANRLQHVQRARLLLPPILGVQPGDLRPVDRVGAVTVPVLVASGAADAYTTAAETEALSARVRSAGELWLVPGASHEDLQRFDPAGYERVVLGFLDRNLRQRT